MADNSKALEIRSGIQEFIDACFKAKVDRDKLSSDSPKYAEALGKYQYQFWINDAANRILSSMKGGNPIKLTTHTLKPINPDAQGANLFFEALGHKCSTLVSTRAVGDRPIDVVGNAAYRLNEYKFLLLKLSSGERLLDLVLKKDAAFAKAIGEDEQHGQELADVFSNVIQPVKSSHTRAKQLYWLVGDDAADIENDAENFHLLAPLYATSLAHLVFQTINHDRFSEEAKEARKAKREGKYAEHSVHSYPNLAAQKMGGTKPQNISQLNSERGGNNYLLASMPPSWNVRDIRPPLKVASVFSHPGVFDSRSDVRSLVKDLKQFLETNPTSDMHTRDLRDDYTAMLMDELALFAMQMHSLPAGWSDDEKCELSVEEIYWLDPGRAEEDIAFREARNSVEWADDIRHRFASWLNTALDGKLPLGDVEFRHWKKALANDATHQRLQDRDRRWMESLTEDLTNLPGGDDDE